MVRKGNPNPTRIKARELVPGDIVEVSSKRREGEGKRGRGRKKRGREGEEEERERGRRGEEGIRV